MDRLELLHQVNRKIVRLRRALGHRHGDWAPDAQRARHKLSQVADALHVERATARGRIHSTQFESLEAQRKWLADTERWRARAEEICEEVGLMTSP